MKEINNGYFTGERPLFNSEDIKINNTIFGEGESPLKESDNIELNNSSFQWKYPLWYCKDVVSNNCSWAEMARAGVWYTDNLLIRDTLIEALRISEDVRILHCRMLLCLMRLRRCGTAMMLRCRRSVPRVIILQ